MKLKMFCFSAGCEVLLQPFIARPQTTVYKFARKLGSREQGKFGLAPERALIIRGGVGSLTRRIVPFASLRLLSLCGTIAPGDWESDERDIWNKI
jgi:hypothetical protein